MKIEKDKVVALAYELEVEGKIADKATKEEPLDYIHGNNVLLPALEVKIEGMSEGDKFDIVLKPEEGYGVYDENKKFPLPKKSFEIDGKIREDLLEVERNIPMFNSSGNVVYGTILEVNDDEVLMDFNHAFAGKTLHFTGEVVSIREATEKELKQGLHGEFLPLEHDCGCGCHHHEHKDCGCHGDANSEDCHCSDNGGECHCHDNGGECHCHDNEKHSYEEHCCHGKHEHGHHCCHHND